MDMDRTPPWSSAKYWDQIIEYKYFRHLIHIERLLAALLHLRPASLIQALFRRAESFGVWIVFFIVVCLVAAGVYYNFTMERPQDEMAKEFNPMLEEMAKVASE